MDTSSPEQSQGELSLDQVMAIVMEAVRSHTAIGDKNVLLFPDEEGRYHCFSKDAHRINKHGKVIDGCHDEAQSTIAGSDVIGKDVYMDMVDDLNIVYEHELLTEELTWKYGYKSKDIDGFDFLVMILIQVKMMIAILDPNLFKMMTCFVTLFVMLKICAMQFELFLRFLQVSCLEFFHNFEEEIVFSPDSDGCGSDRDSDIEDVLQMDFELCIPFGSELFPHHGDSIP